MGNQFAAAAAALITMPSNGLLTGTGWAELWLAAGSPGASAGALSGWLSTNIALPQAERIAALAHRAGVQDVPALPPRRGLQRVGGAGREKPRPARARSEEHTSELQSLMRISYAVFCLKKKIMSKSPIMASLTNQRML